jgi:hypothetical protein
MKKTEWRIELKRRLYSSLKNPPCYCCPASPEAGLFFKPQRAQSSQRDKLGSVP